MNNYLIIIVNKLANAYNLENKTYKIDEKDIISKTR